MKFVSWNVNGLRACLGKGFLDSFAALDADVVCLQETKMQPGQAQVDLPGYQEFWNSAEKKGYSGTAIFTRVPPLSVSYDIGDDRHVGEGRSITLEFEEFYLVTVYTPNAQDGLKRLDYRMDWEDAFRDYLLSLDKVKPVVVCGDLNVAHQEIDLKNPKSNRQNPGFSDQEQVSGWAEELAGKEKVYRLDQGGMGSEDFASFTYALPCAYLLLGAGTPQEDPRYGKPMHNEAVVFNEDVLPTGAALHTLFALRMLAQET